MIHYMLLPKDEMKALRREYRVRLSIAVLFFLSCAVALGIAALIPSYIYTHSQQIEVAVRKAEIEKNRKASGADQIEKDLAESQIIAEKIARETDSISNSSVIEKVISHRIPSISLSSFEVARALGSTTPTKVIIQGKAQTREALLDFKKGLEGDSSFADIELPLSDLAKSKNITFAVRFSFIPKP